MGADKEHSTNKEVKRSDDFQKKVNLKESIIDFLKESLISITDEVFQKAGYSKNEKSAGEYGDGSKYGAGAVENQYIVKIAGKTKSVLTKKIIMDGKSISSDIEIVYKDNMVEFNYLTTEQGFFRGVDKDKKSFTINEKFALDSNNMSELKKELKTRLKDYTKKELGYLTSTKLGIADSSNKSTSSVVETKLTKMKKLTIKELFEIDNIDSENELEPNSDKIKDLNTIDLKDTNPPVDSDKKLFFDEKLNETGEWDESDDEMVSWKEHLYNSLKLISQYTEDKFSIIDVRGFDKYQGPYGLVKINGKNYKIWTTDDDLLWIEDYPVDNTSSEGESTGFKGNVDDIINLINGNYDKNRSTTLRTVPGTDFSLNELTSSGPTISGSEGGYKDGAQSGSGGYNTKNSWKKTPYAKAQQKKPKVTHDYKVVPQNESEKEIKSKEASNKNSSVEKIKTNRNYDPETGNQNWENTNQKNAPKSSNDDFWTEVDLIPGSGYVPKGMDKNYVSGLHDRPGDMKKLGLDENINYLSQKLNLPTDTIVMLKQLTKSNNHIVRDYSEKILSGELDVEQYKKMAGGFMKAVLSGNREDAFARADSDNKKALSSNNDSVSFSDEWLKNIDENKKPDLTKKKFFTESENKERGINKRYLITEKTTEEYEKERFKKLSTFKTRESIKEAEEMNTFFDSLQENKDPERLLNFKKVLNENDFFDETEQETIKPNNKKETIDVEKPNSKFGLTYKFFKSDFLNESKQFIFDINSSVYVKNPNFSNKK